MKKKPDIRTTTQVNWFKLQTLAIYCTAVHVNIARENIISAGMALV